MKSGDVYAKLTTVLENTGTGDAPNMPHLSGGKSLSFLFLTNLNPLFTGVIGAVLR